MLFRTRLGGWVSAALGVPLAVSACTPTAPADKGGQSAAPTPVPAAATLQIESTAFGPQGAIPKKYTCEGADESPPLSWSGVPANAKSLALIVDDPDAPDPKAPKMTWVHWVVYDLPPGTTGLGEGVTELPTGARGGQNDWKRQAYGGPCPPTGRHRYFHKLYALDTMLGDLGTPTKAALEKAMAGHIVGRGELVGTYEKTGEKEPSTPAASGTASAGAGPADGAP